MTVRPLHHPLKSGDLVYFLHIPKTAGTTLTALLESQFKPEEICPYSYRRLVEIPTASPGEMERYRLLCGHHSYRVYRILPRKPVYLTMLRDPVKRVLSLYEHIKRNAEHRQHADYRKGRLSLEQFMEHLEAADRFHNRQVRQIVGAMASAREELREISATREEMEALPDDDLLEIAKIRLQEFAYFGLAERFDDSLRLLGHTFRWEIPAQVARLNSAPTPAGQAAISAEDRATVARYNRLDIELYEHATGLFAERMLQLGEELAAVA